MMYWCIFIDCDTCTRLLWDVDSGGGYESVGEGGWMRNLYFPLNFAQNLKLF